MKLKKNNFNESIKLQNFVNRIQRPIQDPDNIQDGNLSDISPRLKAVSNVTKSTIPDVVRVLEGPRFFWNIINKRKLVSNM